MPHMKCYFKWRHVATEFQAAGFNASGNDALSSDIESSVSASTGDVELDWFLLTSANLSMAAWGILQVSHSIVSYITIIN